MGKYRDVWECVSLSDEATILALLTFYSKFYALNDIDDTYSNSLETFSNLNEMSEDMIIVYADLSVLIRDTVFTEKQQEILTLVMQGFKYEEISSRLGITRQAVSSQVQTICRTIKDTNFNKWSEVACLNAYGSRKGFKRCNTCNKLLKKTKDNFYKRKAYKDGYSNICKECEG